MAKRYYGTVSVRFRGDKTKGPKHERLARTLFGIAEENNKDKYAFTWRRVIPTEDGLVEIECLKPKGGYGIITIFTPLLDNPICGPFFPGVVLYPRTMAYNYSGVGPKASFGWTEPFVTCPDGSKLPCEPDVDPIKVNDGAGTVKTLAISTGVRTYIGEAIDPLEPPPPPGPFDDPPELKDMIVKRARGGIGSDPPLAETLPGFYPTGRTQDWRGKDGYNLSFRGPQNRYGTFDYLRDRALFPIDPEYPSDDYIWHNGSCIAKAPKEVRSAFIVESDADSSIYDGGSTKWLIAVFIQPPYTATANDWDVQNESDYEFFAKPLDVAIKEGACPDIFLNGGDLPTDEYSEDDFIGAGTLAEKKAEYGKWHKTERETYDMPYGTFSNYPEYTWQFQYFYQEYTTPLLFNSSGTQFLQFVNVITDYTQEDFNVEPYIAKAIVHTADIDNITMTTNPTWKKVITYTSSGITQGERKWIVGADYIGEQYVEAIFEVATIKNESCNIQGERHPFDTWKWLSWTKYEHLDESTESTFTLNGDEIFRQTENRLTTLTTSNHTDNTRTLVNSEDYLSEMRIAFLDVRFGLTAYMKVRKEQTAATNTISVSGLYCPGSPGSTDHYWLPRIGTSSHDTKHTFSTHLFDKEHEIDEEMWIKEVRVSSSDKTYTGVCADATLWPDQPGDCIDIEPPPCTRLDGYLIIWDMYCNYAVDYFDNMYCDLAEFTDLPSETYELDEVGDPNNPNGLREGTKVFASKADDIGISVGELLGFGTEPLYEDDEILFSQVSLI